VAANLADKLTLFYAPTLLGAGGVPLMGSLTFDGVDDAPRFRVRSVESFGEDVALTLYPLEPERRHSLFTGNRRHRPRRLLREGGMARIEVSAGPLAEGVNVGDSVAVNGACLTVNEVPARGSCSTPCRRRCGAPLWPTSKRAPSSTWSGR
jgi:hypothetical protein